MGEGDAAPRRTGPEVRVLGPIEVHGPEGRVEIRPGLPRALLAALLLRAPAVVPAEVLIDQLWGERLPSNPANALQVHISYLRRQLRFDGVGIDRQGSGYRLLVDPEAVDASSFERTVRDTAAALPRPPDAARARRLLARLDEALARWRGAPYADVLYLPFTQGEVARLEELWLVAVEQRAELLTLLGRHGEVVAWLHPLVADHPLRERLWALLVLALYRSGRQADALRAFATAREHLVDQLGLEPGPDLRELERAVLEQDPALAWDPLPAGEEDSQATAVLEPPAAPPPERGSGPSAADERLGIPAPVSPLIGRRWEVEAITALLGRHRLVTLTGPGGVGKTRLAYEVAGGRGGPLAVVELAAVGDPEALAPALARALHVPTQPGQDQLAAVADRMGSEPWLLVLDNCEHLIDAAADAVARLLRAAPELRVLATSRQPLAVAAEVAWPVPVLQLPDDGSQRVTEVAAAAAVRLFVDRAKATDARFELTDDNAEAVAAICRALDGLPLAIELAAARTGLLSPAAILERLGDRFTLLSKGGRDAAARQRSLRATVEWSLDLLSPDERRFFAALGVFPGTFDLDAAAAVAGPGLDGDPLELLGSLVERSLVTVAGHDRYSLLDTLRAYARQELEAATDPAPTVAAVQGRHARWYAALAVECDPHSHGPLPLGWPRLRAEAANLRAALRWAFGPHGDRQLGARMVGAVAGAMALEGAFAEADGWLTRAAAVDADDVTAATVWRGIAVLEMYRGRFPSALDAARRSVARAGASGNEVLVASCSLVLGGTLWGLGELDSSITALRAAAERFDRAGDVRGRGFALARLARSMADAGNDAAVGVASDAVDDLETSSDDWMTVIALEHLGHALLVAGDPQAAAARAEQAIALADRVGSHSGRIVALTLLGRIRLALDDRTAAAAAHHEALGRALRVSNGGAIADNVEGLAAVAVAGGDHVEAATLLACADAVRSRTAVAAPATRRLDRLALDAAIDDALDPAAAAAARSRGDRLPPARLVGSSGSPATVAP